MDIFSLCRDRGIFYSKGQCQHRAKTLSKENQFQLQGLLNKFFSPSQSKAVLSAIESEDSDKLPTCAQLSRKRATSPAIGKSKVKKAKSKAALLKSSDTARFKVKPGFSTLQIARPAKANGTLQISLAPGDKQCVSISVNQQHVQLTFKDETKQQFKVPKGRANRRQKKVKVKQVATLPEVKRGPPNRSEFQEWASGWLNRKGCHPSAALPREPVPRQNIKSQAAKKKQRCAAASECPSDSSNARDNFQTEPVRVGDQWGSVIVQHPVHLTSKVEIKQEPAAQTVVKVEASQHLAPAWEKRVQVKQEPGVRIKQEPLEDVVPAKKSRRV